MIIFSNHTNAFLDALVLAVFLKRKMKSLPRGDIFLTSGPVLKWLFEEIGMIPVFRAIEGSEHLHRNEEAFDRCSKVLQQGGIIQVFPEGICIPERRIKSMKKGAARIIFRAEEAGNFSLNTRIIFVGMNYQKAWKFRTDLFLNYSRAFSIEEFVDIYKKHHVAGVNELTKFLKPKLKSQVVHLDKSEYDPLFEQVETLYSSTLMMEYNLSGENLAHRFLISREIAKAINYHFKKEDKEIRAFQQESETYFRQLAEKGLDDRFISVAPGRIVLMWNVLKALTGFPLHLYGLLNNYIPAKITKTLAGKLVKKIDFYSSVSVVAGLCCFLAFYPLLTLLFWLLTSSLTLTAIYAATLYLSGVYSAHYIEDIRNLRARVKWHLFFMRQPDNYRELLKMRGQLENKLDFLKQDYLNRYIK